MNTILVPTDYSEAAGNALHYAGELAMLTNATILLFHAYPLPMPAGDMPITMVSPAELETENKIRIRKSGKEIIERTAGKINVEYRVRPGNITEAITSAAKLKKADLIVMGIKGESKLSRVLIGSNTVSVMNRTKIPVLAIPDGCKYKKAGKMVLAFDYNDTIPKDLLATLKGFIHLFKSELLVLNIVPPEDVPLFDNAIAGLMLENSLKDIKHTLFFPEGKDVIKEINSFVELHHADWLVMLPHKHKFLSTLFHPSNTRQMAFHTHVPLLSLYD